MNESKKNFFPKKQGLYDPAYEKDSCGLGFVANINGIPSRQIVLDAYDMLRNMDHRGACGCEENTGDGSGVLTGLPISFLNKVVSNELHTDLPEKGTYGTGIIFLPTIKTEKEECIDFIEKTIKNRGHTIIGWRNVPVSSSRANIGPSAKASEPDIMQIFIGKRRNTSENNFERELYLIRKYCSHYLRSKKTLSLSHLFYICSLSTKTIIYKGMLTTDQLSVYFDDLNDKDFTSHVAMVHSRFSTNTFPSWDRAQPFRFMSHNGEVNTVKGNNNWMKAREGTLKSDLFGDELSKLFPIIEPDGSDSGNFDNVLEFLLMTGRTLQESILMMIPEAWQKHKNMDSFKKDFYEYHSCMMEPWDGPASIAFTDGDYIGAILDRNGLRPSRYYLTHDDRIIMASEVGTISIDPELVKSKGRLQPGRILLVDMNEGRLIPDDEIKQEFSTNRPYGKWLKNNRIDLENLPDIPNAENLHQDNLIQRMQVFGYTVETMRFMLLPLIHEKRDPVGSMGNDSSLACLSDKPRMLYDYFKQMFAQVTNPAIDSIREEIIMSLECYIGPERNLIESTEKHCNRLKISHPILSNQELHNIKNMKIDSWKTKTIDITFKKSTGSPGMLDAIKRISIEAENAVKNGFSIVVLSDRGINKKKMPLSSILAVGAVHHHLVKKALRTQIGIVLETGEAREVHHHCLLIGYGADAINPYLAFEALCKSRLDGLANEKSFPDDDSIVLAYKKGVAKGILKVLAKMGISTLQSYKGAQVFEAIGLKDEVIDLAFCGTASRVQGVGFDVIFEEIIRRHSLGFPENEKVIHDLTNPGEFHWRAEGEVHAWNPESISYLQKASTENNIKSYELFSDHINGHSKGKSTLRGLMDFSFNKKIPIKEVEPASEIVKRFCTGAMSFGSISAEAHESLAIAMNRIGGKSNTGEGGEDPIRFELMKNGDSKRSAIKQVASGRFGVSIWYLSNADEIQIKVAQGAKPGEGGELPGHKVDKIIGKIRNSTPGVGLISPPPHHDIYSIEDLAQLIYDLKNSNPSARISVKLVSEVGVGTIAAGVAKAHADHIVIAGASGGTGASPLTSIKHAGLPWELGIAETHQTLILNDLRSRVVLQTDGGIKTGRDIVLAALLGAEEVGFATAPLVTMGCIMMRKCHLNTCPVGVATQNPELRKKFSGQPEHVINYLFFVAEEARKLMSNLGFRNFNEMVGRSDKLMMEKAINHWKSDGIDLSSILTPVKKPHSEVGTYCTQSQDHGLDAALDNKLIKMSKDAIDHGKKVNIKLPIKNINRTVGTILSHIVVKSYGSKMLPDGTINIKFNGSAGQSFGAFLAKGIDLNLEGDSNDYVGKGLSGGTISIFPPKKSSFKPEENIIVGNVCLYGATSGNAFISGRAAERFCVRNSGAIAVVEGVGDHGCEYMTGGRVIVLGPTGRNFAAGMSGGIAYVWDQKNLFKKNCNLEMVELEDLIDNLEIKDVKMLINEHVKRTKSKIGNHILKNWDFELNRFVKVMPTDYKRVLNEIKIKEKNLLN